MCAGDLAEAEEVVQEAFARAVAQGARFAQVDNPEAWLRVVAVNQARSRHRRRRVGELLHLTGERRDLDDPAARSDAHVVLMSALRRLPHAQREAIALHHLADLPVGEVAAALGVPTGTVKARLSRGRTALAAMLEEIVPVPEPATNALLGGGA